MNTRDEKTKTKSLSFSRKGERKGGERTSAGSGARVVYVGGNANNGANDGVGYFNVNNGLSNSNADIVWAVKERKTQRLMFRIIDGFPCGIPIGNALSPLLANLHLTHLDHAAKEKFHIKGYYRYLDDFVALDYGPDAKSHLKEFSAYARQHLASLGLEIKSNEQVYPIERGGLDFLGYIFHRKSMRLRLKTERRFRRAAARYLKKQSTRNRATLSSYWGIVKWISQSSRFWYSLFDKPIHELEVQP